ncbi:MAG: GNAT family N-acetyltransferase [Anaerolineae bacterium]|nr:GNAT family N-acetyltransferase [Anaerolineae bacterium]
MRIKRFDQKTATDSEMRAFHEFDGQIHTEVWPGDPHTPYEQFARNWRNQPPLWRCHVWLAWDGDRVVGKAETWTSQTGTNEHLMDGGIDILPAYRRQGLARRLLAEMVEAARQEDKTLFIFGTSDIVPAGEAFMNRLGAEQGLTTHTNQLDLADVDRGLMRQWIQRAQDRAAGYRLGLWVGPYPEAELEGIAAMYAATNDAPHDDLNVEDEHRTPDQLREMDASMVARGNERWSMYVREEATGALAGFSEIFWNPAEPETAYQGWTAVVPQYRNLGLGRWLKAAMIEKLDERPQVKRVRTGNADSNGPMLGINHEMGFKPYRAWTVWQVERAKVAAYLAGAAEDGQAPEDEGRMPEVVLVAA